MRNITFALAASAAALTAACTSAPANPLDETIRRHTEARGGAAAIDAVKNIRTEVEVIEPGFTVTGDYRARDGAMRIDIYADGVRVFSEGVYEGRSWQQGGAGAPVTATSDAGRAALLHGIEFNLFGLHQLEARGHALSLEGEETVDGAAYKVVKVTLGDGFETYLYINQQTSMLERRRDIRALHPDADPTEKLIENLYFDFTDYCGVLSPASSRQIDVRTGEELQRTRIIKQDCNLSEEALQLTPDAAAG